MSIDKADKNLNTKMVFSLRPRSSEEESEFDEMSLVEQATVIKPRLASIVDTLRRLEIPFDPHDLEHQILHTEYYGFEVPLDIPGDRLKVLAEEAHKRLDCIGILEINPPDTTNYSAESKPSESQEASL